MLPDIVFRQAHRIARTRSALFPGSSDRCGCAATSALYYLLRNAIYVGRIAHRGASYAGQHPGIVPQDLWDQARALLTENRQGGRRGTGSSEPCVLSGLLFDDRGNVMSPSHARKANGRRYRYYVSQAVLQGRQEGAGSIRRVSAEAIETLIERTLWTSWRVRMDVRDPTSAA
jgi:site-specific DNA recombinase